jgi:hypothetical protein
MMVVLWPTQLKPRWTIAKITTVYNSELLKGNHSAVDSRRIHGHAFTLYDPPLEGFDGERALFMGQ